MAGRREIYLSVYLSIPWNCTIRQLIAAGRGIRAASGALVLMDPKEGGRGEGRGLNGGRENANGGFEWKEPEGGRHYKVAEVREC